MLILHNAKIHSLSLQPTPVEAIALETRSDAMGRVLALGSLDTLRAEFASRAKFEDMGGRTILPGLTDAHIHLRNYGHSLDHVKVDTPSRNEALQRVAERVRETAPGVWIRGHGWRQNEWPEGFGDAELLDQATPQNPVYLTAASLHAAWVNSAALSAARITADTADPPDGRIQRNPDGTPTGILFEAAMKLVSEVIPQPTPEEDIAAIQRAQQELWSVGLTSVHDFDRRRSFVALQSLHQRGELRLRVLKQLPVELLDHAIALGMRSGLGDDMLRIGAIKIFADGALGPRTAAMLEPYESEPENRGMLFIDSEELFELGQQAARGGFGLTIHAIGDRANHEVLNAFEQLRKFEQAEGLTSHRHRIEHVQVLHPDDMPKLAALNIAASMQPFHAISDMEAAQKYWGDRSQHAYAWNSLLKTNTLLAFGSDAPVESPNPFLGLHAAVTRRRVDGNPGPDGWYPLERLSLAESLAAYTTGPARLAGMEDRLGLLAPGYLADLIVLDQDPFEMDAGELQLLKPSATMLGGQWVWRI